MRISDISNHTTHIRDVNRFQATINSIVAMFKKQNIRQNTTNFGRSSHMPHDNQITITLFIKDQKE